MNASVTNVGDAGLPHSADTEMTALFWGLQYCLASGISGPGLASPSASSVQRSAVRGPVPDIGWPDPDEETPEPRLKSALRTYGPKVALLLALAGATGAIIVATL